MSTRPAILCAVAMFSFAGSAQACLVPLPLTSPAPVIETAPQAICVQGFSKDYCNGQMQPGFLDPIACPSPTPEGSCRTLTIKQATFGISVVSNTAPCGATSHTKCDESLNGRLKVASNFIIRLQENCPYRGCWDGTAAEFTFADNSVYRGVLLGTIGVGTHRPMTGLQICAAIPPSDRTCERCYDVSFDGNTSQWRIGYEATFHGTRADADTGQELCFSLSGDFLITGTATTGPDFSTVWRAVGTADGIHFTFCP